MRSTLLAVSAVSLLWAAAPPGIDPASISGSDGYFRAGRTRQGTWWVIDPQDRLVFLKSAGAVSRTGTGGARQAVPGPYAATVDENYRYRESPERFVTWTVQRLRGWGFNSLGAWTAEEFYGQGIPHTEILEFNRLEPKIVVERNGRRLVDLPDVFSPAWQREVEILAARICTPLRDRRDLIGYFTDNEMDWAQFHGADGGETAAAVHDKVNPSLLQLALSLDPERAAHQAAWQFVTSRHGNVTALSRAWGVRIPEASAVRGLTRQGQSLASRAYRQDDAAFSRTVAERYFRLTSEAIRKYDPNHLVLGCRFGGAPGGEILREVRRPYVDVLSANCHRDTLAEQVAGYHQETGLPVLIGEFSWASEPFTRDRADDPHASLSPRWRALARGADSLLKAVAEPGLVGYTWPRWAQEESGDDSSPGYGLVDEDDREVLCNTEQLRWLAPLLEPVHRTRDPNYLPAEMDVVPVATNSVMAEGPSFDSSGNLYFTNYRRTGTIGRLSMDGALKVWAEISGGRPNGTKVDRQGNVIVADPAGRRILRISPAGEITTLAASYGGQPLRAPNDVFIDAADNIWFTAPLGSTLAKPDGEVFRLTPGGVLTRVGTDLAFPNGLVLSPDNRQLFIAEMGANRITTFDTASDGSLSNRRVFHQFPTPSADGIALDRQGRLWVARFTNRSVDVLTPAGTLLRSYAVPHDRVTNVAFFLGRPYVTAIGGSGVFRLDPR